MQITEGRVTFILSNAFYRPHSKRSRDLGCPCSSRLQASHGTTQCSRYETGCGIRALQYAIADLYGRDRMDRNSH